jgi:hypothetical protein
VIGTVYERKPLGRRTRSELGVDATFIPRRALILCIACHGRGQGY